MRSSLASGTDPRIEAVRAAICAFLLACSSKVEPMQPIDAGETFPDAAPTDSGEVDSGVPVQPYTIAAFEEVRISSHSEDEHFQRATSMIDFRDGPFAEVRMIVALSSTCYPFESWQNNQPPPGHNFPENCDAFDRNFELSLRDPMPLELMRAITPFGSATRCRWS